ncbi:MAG: hypothetical protein KTR33_13125 [Gammaproteobacteria bacterium]|nr:hypothetical protein [Gammaproteobacteria bacterium]
MADFKAKDGLLIMEAESHSGGKGDWDKETFVEGYTGKCHYEFTGNSIMGGQPSSDLKYKFTVDKDGIYHLWIRAHKRLVGDDGKKARHDLCNDCWVRMKGDFESGNDTPLETLESDTKLYVHGKSAETWDWTHRLDYKHPETGKHTYSSPVYRFKAGEKYTLYISGRSQRFNMDRIVLKHEDIPTHEAQDPEQPESEQ